MCHFNFMDIEPVRTYATQDGAKKRATEVLSSFNDPAHESERLCNVMIVPIEDQKTGTLRYFPLVINVRHEHHLTQIAMRGINVVN